jgi:hypothetical protein
VLVGERHVILLVGLVMLVVMPTVKGDVKTVVLIIVTDFVDYMLLMEMVVVVEYFIIDETFI